MAFALAACSQKENSEVKQEETKKLEGTLKVIATSENYQPLFDKFTKEAGPKVEFISMSSGEVLSKLKAEGGTPAADGLTADYKDGDNYWFSKGITVVGFIGNNDILKEKGLEAPKSWDDLTKPEYKGEILMSNPAISGTNFLGVPNH